jgi:3-oxoacyl-[acyl-carrier-protein] synthase-3
MSIHILGTGSYLPPRILHNRDIESILDTTDEWISQRTGIHERRIADPDIAASDLALEASRSALEMAGVKPEEVQLIIMATITPDTHCPAGANWLQAKLETPQAVTFDITAACSGFIFAPCCLPSWAAQASFHRSRRALPPKGPTARWPGT